MPDEKKPRPIPRPMTRDDLKKQAGWFRETGREREAKIIEDSLDREEEKVQKEMDEIKKELKGMIAEKKIAEPTATVVEPKKTKTWGEVVDAYGGQYKKMKSTAEAQTGYLTAQTEEIKARQALEKVRAEEKQMKEAEARKGKVQIEKEKELRGLEERQSFLQLQKEIAEQKKYGVELERDVIAKEKQAKFAQTHPWMQTAGEKTLKFEEKGYATARKVLAEAKAKQTPTQYARASSRQMKLLQRIQKMQMGGRERVSRAGARQVEAGTSLYRATLPSQVQQQQYVGQQMMQPQSEFEKLIGGKKDMNVGLFGEQQLTGQPAPSKLSPENLVGMGQKKYDVLGTGNKKYDLLGSSDKNIGLFGEASKKKKQNYY